MPPFRLPDFLRNERAFLPAEVVWKALQVTPASAHDPAGWETVRVAFEALPFRPGSADANTTAHAWCETVLFPWLGLTDAGLRRLDAPPGPLPTYGLPGELADADRLCCLVFVVAWEEADLDAVVLSDDGGRYPVVSLAGSEMERREVDWGLLTNGRRLRLVHRRHCRSARVYLEADLEALVRASDAVSAARGARQVQALFGASAFVWDRGGKSAVDRYCEAGHRYCRRVVRSVRADPARPVDELLALWKGLAEQLPARALGDLYEKQLSAAGEPGASARRRSTGAFYTPDLLVRRVVQSALAPLLTRPSGRAAPDEISAIRLLDPAMGCGHFLLEALDQLTDAYVDATIASDAPATQSLPSLRIHARRLIAANCLYGVDIDDIAVRLARLVIGREAGGVSTDEGWLQEHLRVGDALNGAAPGQRDDPRLQRFWRTDHPAAQGGFRAIDERAHARAFHWETEFPERFCWNGVDSTADGAGFSCVVGNPPYVSLYSRQSQRASRAQEFRDYACLALADIAGQPALGGRINDFLLFLVRSIQLTAAHGSGGLVLPDTILTNESYARCRRALTASGQLRGVVRVESGVFPGAGVGTALLFWTGAAAAGGEVEIAAWEGHSEKSMTRRAAPDELLRVRHCAWTPTPSPPRAGMILLDEIAWIKDGINPGPRAVRARLLTSAPDGDPTLCPCLEGRSIEPFRCREPDLWVRYDQALLDAPARKTGASLRKPWIFESPRIVYRQTAPHLIAAVVLAGCCSTNSVHNVILKSPDETVLFALCAYLNSRRCREEYQAATGETRRLFPQVHISAVRHLPVPVELLDVTSPRTRELASLAKRLCFPGGECLELATDSQGLAQKIDCLAEALGGLP